MESQMATVQSKSATRSRDQNGVEARVLKSAIKLFSEKGYSATTIREIIAEAGVTRPVLYYYFKNKELKNSLELIEYSYDRRANDDNYDSNNNGAFIFSEQF